MFLRGSTGAVLGLALLHATMAVAVSPADKCVAAKLKVAGKYNFCRLKTDATAIRTGARADYTTCDSAFARKWARAEARGGGACPPTADKLSVQNQVLIDSGVMLKKITLPRFLDNGDGTVTDLDTNLMWEKKDDLDGIHNKDNFYTWSAMGTAPDGTAFTTFLATLNNGTSDGTTMISGCFANYCDWRMPTYSELLTILSENCSLEVVLCLDAVFGPTPSPSTGLLVVYWSSTTWNSDPLQAIALRFEWFFGSPPIPGPVLKTQELFVRAVRGGS